MCLTYVTIVVGDIGMLHEHIYIDSATGKPCIAGTGIRVWDVYVLSERVGKSPDQIVAAYPHLTLADVHAALAYYWDNKDTIDRQMKEADEFVQNLKSSVGPGPLARKAVPVDIS
jgi:uncharacterized protein (DUF433 family)